MALEAERGAQARAHRSGTYLVYSSSGLWSARAQPIRPGLDDGAGEVGVDGEQPPERVLRLFVGGVTLGYVEARVRRARQPLNGVGMPVVEGVHEAVGRVVQHLSWTALSSPQRAEIMKAASSAIAAVHERSSACSLVAHLGAI